MRISLRLLTSVIGICVVSAAVTACGGTESLTATNTPINSPTQPPANLPSESQTLTSSPTLTTIPTVTKSSSEERISSHTQLPANLPSKSQTLTSSERKSESEGGGDQVDIGALIQEAKSSPQILGCLMSTIGMSTLTELTNRIPTPQEFELILSCFDEQQASGVTDTPYTQPQSPVALLWPEHVGTNRIGKLGDELSEWEGGWIRPHAGRFIWGLIESKPGRYAWTFTTDKQVKRWQNEDLAVLVTIWPFASWDQDLCHSDRPDAIGMFPGMGTRLYSPCDTQAYSDWLTAAVERYDGDGVDDMPGLKYPIRHWEVLNEPEMQGPELTFFQEDSQSYLELLKLSYRAIKYADLNSIVLLGGQAGMQSKFVDYWEPVLRGAAGYFDVGNIHSISSSDPDFFVSEYRDFLDDNNFETTSFWVTEALVGTPPGEQKLDEDGLARFTMTSYASAFAAGADVIFNVGGHDPTGGPGVFSAKTVQLMAQVLGRFNTVSQLEDNLIEFDMSDENSVFVLWNNAVLPSTVSGKVTVIDYLGNESIQDAIEVSGASPRMVIVGSR